MTTLHRLVTKQLAKATGPSGDVNPVLLCELMSTCYEEMERDRRRVDRANKLMQEDLVELTGDMEQLIEKLRVQNLHFQAALDNMSQGLCLADAEGRLSVANQRFLEMYHLEASAVTPGRSVPGYAYATGLGRHRDRHSNLAAGSADADCTVHRLLRLHLGRYARAARADRSARDSEEALR